jgi:hypothetical protein
MNTAKSRHSGPGARPDACRRPALDGEVARLEVDEQRRARVERPEQAGLADAGLAEDAALDAARLGEPLVGGDDGERHVLARAAASTARARRERRHRARSG